MPTDTFITIPTNSGNLTLEYGEVYLNLAAGGIVRSPTLDKNIARALWEVFDRAANAPRPRGHFTVEYGPDGLPDWTTARPWEGPETTPPPTAPFAAKADGPTNCNIWRQAHPGTGPYPRTCERCKLGPCLFYNDDGSTRS